MSGKARSPASSAKPFANLLKVISVHCHK
jgi:hypothetical protein